MISQITARYSVRERRTAAMFFLGSYAWYITASVIASYLMDRRVPSLAVDDIAIRFELDGDEPQIKVALLNPGFAALPADSAADLAPVAICANLHDLRDHLRKQIEDHMQDVITFLTRHTRLGQRGQWNMVADTCAEVCLWIGQQMADQERACAEGIALIKMPGSPMRPSPTQYLTLAVGDRCETFRMRGSCCLYYKTPTAKNCNTCPLLSEAERVQRLRTGMQGTAEHA